MSKRVVILANGRFPESEIPLGYLTAADTIICCDGAVGKLVDFGLEPHAIVGDMDSVSSVLKDKYSDKLLDEGDDQESNDLTKAVKYCIANNIFEVIILGANGLREDHTIGNVSLLFDYADFISVKMVSDYGIFIPLVSSAEISSWSGQQVSIFSDNQNMKVSSSGLKYPLEEMRLSSWWMGTLNESNGDKVKIDFTEGKVLVYLAFIQHPLTG